MGEPAGDVERGKKIYMQRCAQCHTIAAGGGNRSGPNLHGFFGKKSGYLPGYESSAASKSKGITWNKDTINAFLENPKQYIPGTKMNTPGMRKAQERADLIAYMEQAAK